MNQPPVPPAPPPADPATLLQTRLTETIAIVDRLLKNPAPTREEFVTLHAQMTGTLQTLSAVGALVLAPGVDQALPGSAMLTPRAVRQAYESRQRAKKLRERAKVAPTMEERQDCEREAEWQDARAAARESGVMFLPPELRTEFDRCEVVNHLRRAAAGMLDGMQADIEPMDAQVFAVGLARGKRATSFTAEELAALAPVQEAAVKAIDAWAVATMAMVNELGGTAPQTKGGKWDWQPTMVDAGPTAAAPGQPGAPIIAPTGTRLPKAPGAPSSSTPSNGGASA